MHAFCSPGSFSQLCLLAPSQVSLGDWFLRACARRRDTAKAAYRSVELPDAVVDVLTALRNYLQDKCEPPIYVSDRRFMKAVNLLQVAAYADGRDQVLPLATPVHGSCRAACPAFVPTAHASQVNEYDCLLLEHVFGQRPDDSHKVKAYVLENIASDPSLQQTELLFLGLFGRACRVTDSGSSAVRPRCWRVNAVVVRCVPGLACTREQARVLCARQELEEVRREADALAELLELRQGGLAMTLDGGFPELRASVWNSEAAVQAAVQTLTPQMAENRKRAEDLLREALLLRAALDAPASPGLLERLLPKRFKQFQKGISGRA